MGAAVKESVSRKAACFASAAELREILERLLKDLDADPDYGPRLNAARVPHRYEFPDLGVVLNVSHDIKGEHCLLWRFSDRVDWKPKLRLEMDSDVANRFLQGEENLAIAIARGRIRASGEGKAALSLLPESRALIKHYRRLVSSDYPHLRVH